MTDPEKSKSGPRRKLTEADVLEIVARCQSGEPQAAVARDFPVTTGMVGAIVRGIAWSHLTGIEPHKRGYARGEAVGNAKLTRSQVLEIVRRCRAGEPPVSVARDFPVNKEQVNVIMRGGSWSHLTGIKRGKGYLRGEDAANAKLTEADVLEIVQRYEAGETQTSIARDFPVKRNQVSQIVIGKAWVHVTGIKRRRGRRLGEDVPTAKLTESDVLEIVRRYEAGETQASIARDFPVSRDQVSHIVSGKAWGHVTGIKRRKGRRLGEDVPTAKLTEADVLEIVQRYQAGENNTAIARDFPVSRDQVRKIVNGKAWVHVTGIQASDTTDE